MNKVFTVHSIKDYQIVFEYLDELIQDKTLVLFNGSVGAGKTTFIRQWLSYLKIPNHEMASPTFSLIHDYSTNDKKIFHADLYRLSDESEVESSGLWDLFQEDQFLFLIEWPDRVASEWWPAHIYQVNINIIRNKDTETRQIEIS